MGIVTHTVMGQAVYAAYNEVSCRIDAPCKINLHLRVGDARADGFHDLESIFLSLAFGDTLWVTMLPEGAGPPDCSIQMEGAVLSGGENSIDRAVSLFRERTGFRRSLQIRVKKRIPLGGGMGGGSSNGASVLMALNALNEAALSLEVMEEMAALLGSDVPFFLSGGAAWVSGRGERIESLPPPQDLWVVLVNPGFSSGTPAAFALLDRVRGERRVESGFTAIDPEVLKSALRETPASWPYGNDFLPVFLDRGDEAERQAYDGILRDFKALGSEFSGLSGTGATCFGLFTERGAAGQAAKVLAQKWNFVQATFPLAHSAHAVLQ